MPIDPSMMAKSTGTLTDLHPQRDLAKTLQDAVVAARPLFDVDVAGVSASTVDTTRVSTTVVLPWRPAGSS